jgi:LmbE family N-acetylglucosaminyl deacetylase
MRLGEALAQMQALPFGALDEILPARPLILAPHPDDESLGCGGLIAAATAAGMRPVVAVLSDGAGSHPGSVTHPPPALAALRATEARRAMALLGVAEHDTFLLGYPDAALPAQGQDFDRAVEKLAWIALGQGCGVVVSPWCYDPHCDHEAAAAMGIALAERSKLILRHYPVWAWLRDPEHSINEHEITGWRFEISAQLAIKRAAIAAHASQCGEVIRDSPGGFTLPADLLEILTRPYEVFLG